LKSASAVGVVGLAGCGGSGGADEVSATFATAHGEGHYNDQALTRLKDTVESETDGSFTLEAVAGGAYGGSGEMTETLSNGGIEGQASGPIPQFLYANAQYSFMASPFVLDNADHLRRVHESEMYQNGLDEIREESDIRSLGIPYSIGPRGFVSQFPIRTPDDVIDRELRFPGLPPFIQTWEEVGVDPTSVSLDELYSALQQGVAEGTSTNVSQALSFDLNEVTSHYSETDHMVDFGQMWISDEFYQDLDETYQDVVTEAASSISEDIAENAAEAYEEDIAEMEDRGMTIVSDTDPEAFREAASDAVDSLFESTWVGTWDEVRNI
jgi:TRAP-type C4-dicarboxylate transport system substrate-binding protein